MKIRIEIDDEQSEEIVIRCKKMTKEIDDLQSLIKESFKNKQINIALYKDSQEFFISIDKILFFETDGNIVNAHTVDDMFQVKYKLYELEEMLPSYFMRVSKSTILNINEIYSINKKIQSSSEVMFQNTYKQVYVSRMYIKPLMEKMKGRY